MTIFTIYLRLFLMGPQNLFQCGALDQILFAIFLQFDTQEDINNQLLRVQLWCCFDWRNHNPRFVVGGMKPGMKTGFNFRCTAMHRFFIAPNNGAAQMSGVVLVQCYCWMRPCLPFFDVCRYRKTKLRYRFPKLRLFCVNRAQWEYMSKYINVISLPWRWT